LIRGRGRFIFRGANAPLNSLVSTPGHGESKGGEYGVPAKTKFLWGKKPLLYNQFPLMIGIHIHIMERGIKWVPRKIEDFSGCLRGVRLAINSGIIN